MIHFQISINKKKKKKKGDACLDSVLLVTVNFYIVWFLNILCVTSLSNKYFFFIKKKSGIVFPTCEILLCNNMLV